MNTGPELVEDSTQSKVEAAKVQPQDIILTKSGLMQEKTHALPGVWTSLITKNYPGKQDDICFVDENKGWYVNGYGRIYHSRDEGKFWEKQLEQKDFFPMHCLY